MSRMESERKWHFPSKYCLKPFKKDADDIQYIYNIKLEAISNSRIELQHRQELAFTAIGISSVIYDMVRE